MFMRKQIGFVKNFPYFALFILDEMTIVRFISQRKTHNIRNSQVL